MKKLLFLLLGFCLNVQAMHQLGAAGDDGNSPKKEKQKERVDELVAEVSSGTLAPSSSGEKVTSTRSSAGVHSYSDSSSSAATDMAQIDLNKEGHAMTKKEKRRSLVPVDAENLDDVALAETVFQVLQAREEKKKQQQEAVLSRLQTNDKQEKRKSVNLWLKKKNAIPQLRLGDIEQGMKESSLTDDELERIIDFIAQATGNDVKDIKDRLKATLRELHNTPPASPLFLENISVIDALNTVRKLTSDHISTTRVVDSLKKRQQPVHALQPADVVVHEGFEAGLVELLKLVNKEFATKLQQTGKARNIYKGITILAGAATAGFTIYEAYNKATGDDSSTPTPTCAPPTTFPM